jgi:hypothetical protein
VPAREAATAGGGAPRSPPKEREDVELGPRVLDLAERSNLSAEGGEEEGPLLLGHARRRGGFAGDRAPRGAVGRHGAGEPGLCLHLSLPWGRCAAPEGWGRGRCRRWGRWRRRWGAAAPEEGQRRWGAAVPEEGRRAGGWGIGERNQWREKKKGERKREMSGSHVLVVGMEF